MEQITEQIIVLDNAPAAVEEAANDTVPTVFAEADLMFELGVWLSGLESFLGGGDHRYAAVGPGASATRDHTRGFRLTLVALMRCSRLYFRMGSATGERSDSSAGECLSPASYTAFGRLLRDTILLNEGLIKAGPLGFGEWGAWSKTLSERLHASPEVKTLIAFAEKTGDAYLPDSLANLLQVKKMPFADEAELQVILPQFARILKWLSVVGRMLREDEPLKPTLLIFSRVHEQTTELIAYIDQRLARFPDETAELFGSLDGASYTASLELKKVYNQELIGLIGVRPAPSVYARIETSYALLNDSFQQILTGFARLIDPSISMLDVFPNFRTKLDQSLLLREHLARVLRSVQAAEENPEKAILETLHKELKDLVANTMRFLFYKDRETIERFGEEVMAAGDKKDLIPILHRFGAYLETLFGQVNMRTVLVDQPFTEIEL